LCHGLSPLVALRDSERWGWQFQNTRLAFLVFRLLYGRWKLKRPLRGAYGKIYAKTKPKTMGQRIRMVRMTWKWSQTQLAKALGTNQKTVSHWEQERQQPTDATMHSLASLFGMSVEALISGKEFSIPEPPQLFDNIFIPANLAVDLIRLPRASKNDILLVLREDESVKQLSPQKAFTLIRQAKEDGRSVWIVM
jgi:DNA-binding XRE family transcriptional regulator